jgi:predicted metal-dependent hydrolase
MQPQVEVRRSSRRKRTVSAYRADGKVIVLIPARFTKAEEAQWVQDMVARLERKQQRQRRSDTQLMTRARELSAAYLDGRAERAKGYLEGVAAGAELELGPC